MTYLLGLDISTTGAKALVVDETGHVAAGVTTEHPLSTPKPLWSEQRPADWWKAVTISIREASALAKISGGDIAGVGLTGQMHGLVLLDAKGDVLRPAILWNDQRTGEECAEIVSRAGGASRVLSLTANAMLPGFTAPKIRWVEKNEPDVAKRAVKFLLPKDYLRFRLTGEYASDVSDASGTALFDVSRRTWSDEMAALLHLPKSFFPRVTESTEISGRVNAVAAAETGLPVGTPVVGGAGDQAAQAVGSGICREGMISVTVGTSGVVFAHAEKFAMEPEGRLHAFCHAIPGKWHVMGVMLSAGGSFRWFRDVLGEPETSEAKKAGADPYEFLTREAAKSPAGSEGLLFLPYLSGERTPHPDPLARGAFVGLTARHGRPQLIRAVLEGISFGLRDGMELVKALGVPIREVRASGGGAKSALWRQIQADIFGTELTLVNTTEGAAFGAALLAGVGVGVYPNVEAAVAMTVRVTHRTVPHPEQVCRYESLYPVYRSLYPALKASFRK